MEYREYSCPFCKEKMQVPTDKTNIKCMFCGRDIVVVAPDDPSGNNGFDDSTHRDVIENSIPEIIECRESFFGRFNKKYYESAYKEFKERFAPLLNTLYTLVLSDEAGVKKAGALLSEFPEKLADTAYNMCMTSEKKRELTHANELINLYVVTFLLPAIQDRGGDHMTDLLDDICDAWKDKFPMGNIGHSTYEDLSKGFKKGIFGMFAGKF